MVVLVNLANMCVLLSANLGIMNLLPDSGPGRRTACLLSFWKHSGAADRPGKGRDDPYGRYGGSYGADGIYPV